jgi:hypothetical protein
MFPYTDGRLLHRNESSERARLSMQGGPEQPQGFVWCLKIVARLHNIDTTPLEALAPRVKSITLESDDILLQRHARTIRSDNDGVYFIESGSISWYRLPAKVNVAIHTQLSL